MQPRSTNPPEQQAGCGPPRVLAWQCHSVPRLGSRHQPRAMHHPLAPRQPPALAATPCTIMAPGHALVLGGASSPCVSPMSDTGAVLCCPRSRGTEGMGCSVVAVASSECCSLCYRDRVVPVLVTMVAPSPCPLPSQEPRHKPWPQHGFAKGRCPATAMHQQPSIDSHLRGSGWKLLQGQESTASRDLAGTVSGQGPWDQPQPPPSLGEGHNLPAVDSLI